MSEAAEFDGPVEPCMESMVCDLPRLLYALECTHLYDHVVEDDDDGRFEAMTCMILRCRQLAAEIRDQWYAEYKERLAAGRTARSLTSADDSAAITAR